MQSQQCAIADRRGLLRAWASDRYEAFSAGTEATEVRPLAIRAMAEVGIDISTQVSKTVHAFGGQRFDYAVTVCDDAREACPFFPAAEHQLHWSFDDPAAAVGSEDDQMAVYRRVREEIGTRIRQDLLRV